MIRNCLNVSCSRLSYIYIEKCFYSTQYKSFCTTLYQKVVALLILQISSQLYRRRRKSGGTVNKM